MKKFLFKTNINCSGCVAQVTPHLNTNKGIENWSVDTSNPDKILSIESSVMTREELAELVRNAGFKAEPIS